jgi:hypothetical protein
MQAHAPNRGIEPVPAFGPSGNLIGQAPSSTRLANLRCFCGCSVASLLSGQAAAETEISEPPKGATIGLRQEVKDYNIRVTTISPGAVRTKLTDHITEPGTGGRREERRGRDWGAGFAISEPDDLDVNEILFRPTVQPVGPMYTRHPWIFRRDARPSRPIAASRLLAIGPAIARRRALRSDTIDAPRLPKKPCAMGISLT